MNNQERMRVRVCLCVSLWVNMADIVLFVLVIFTFLFFFYIREQYDDLLSFELDNVILFCCSLTILPYMNIGIHRYVSFMLFLGYTAICAAAGPQ